MTQLEILLEIIRRTRFAGRVARLGPQYGFVKLDNAGLDLLLHRDICESIPWDELRVGDRLRFNVKESVAHPGKLVVSRPTREKNP